MALKDLLQMTEVNRYTQDGRDKINALQDKVTEDVTYKIGDISQKTGLQKTANGWVKPKGGQGKKSAKPEAKGAPKQKKENPAEKMKLSEGQQAILQQQKEKAGQPRNPDFDLSKAGYGEKKTWQEKKTEELANKIREKSGPGRTFQLMMGANGQPTLGKEVKTYRTKKEAQEALNKQKADRNAKLYEGGIKELVGHAWNTRENWTEEELQKEYDLDKTDAKTVKEKLDRLANPQKADNSDLYELETESKPDAAEQRDQIGAEIKESLEAARYYLDKANSFYPSDPSYKTYMEKAKKAHDEAKAQADDNGFYFEEMHDPGVTRAIKKYSEGNKPDKVGDFMKAYERGDFGKYQQNAEQKKAESFFKQNKPKTYTSKEGRRNFRAALEDNPKDAYDFSKTVEHSIPMSAGDKEQLANIKSFMQDENTDYKDAIKSVATGLVNGNQMRGDWYPEKEQSVLKIAKSVGLEKELMNYIKANHKGYEFGYSEDAAPKIRELTGDCKIRVRK
jgi:hypothetical protein